MIKRIIKKYMSSATAFSGIALTVLSLSGCSTDDTTLSSRTGRLSVDVIADTSVKMTKESRAGGPEYDPNNILANISVNDLSLKLVNAEGSYSKTWDSFADFSAEEEFPVGNYTLSAFYGDEAEEGIEKPWLLGEAEVNIKGCSSTPVTLEATVSNSITAVDFTDDFKDFFPVYSVALTSVNKNVHRFSGAEHTPLYIGAGETGVTADVTLEDGRTGTIQLSSFTARAATYHKITMDVNASKGTLIMTVSFEDNLEETTTEIEIGDQLVDGDGPVVTPEGFEGNVAMPFVEGNLINNSYKFNIVARRGFKEVTLIRSSPRYGGGFQETYNLLYEAARRDLQEEHGIEFIGLGQGEMFGKIDLSNWVKDLRRYDRALESEEITFTLRVVDQNGATTDIDLADNNTFKVSLYGESLKVVPVEDSMTDESYKVRIETNMNWLSGRLKLSQYETIEGRTEMAYPSYKVLNDSIIDPTYSTDNVFIIEVPTPGSFFKFEHTTETNAGVKVDENLIYMRPLPNLMLKYDEDDIFVTHGHFTVTGDENTEGAVAFYNKVMNYFGGKLTAKVTNPENGKSVEARIISGYNNYFNFEGLEITDEQNKSGESLNLICSASISAEGMVKEQEIGKIKTERTLQLYNGDMESWNRIAGRSDYWWTDYPFNQDDSENKIWATLNELTTSEGGSSPGSLLAGYADRNAYAYNAGSGTQYTTDCNSGSKAAIIRTIGWGQGNSAVGSGGSSGTCKNLTAGELFLGSYSLGTGATRGITFLSRPTKLRFFYKYKTVVAGNGDKGYVQFRVLDISKNVLSEQSVKLDEQSQYQVFEVPMSYMADDKSSYKGKSAAYLEVNFRSSAEPDIYANASNRNDNYLSGPGFGNLNTGEYLGSQLYIDDIELIY